MIIKDGNNNFEKRHKGECALKLLFWSLLSISLFSFSSCSKPQNESGNKLWLRNGIENNDNSFLKVKNGISIANKELSKYWKGDDVELILTNRTDLHKDGFFINYKNKKALIEARSHIGLLYGSYELIRLQNTGKLKNNLSVIENPSYDIRILNHWDNLDGTVERGYAGKSIWKWDQLPDTISSVYDEYAKANASIGINGVVLNNVNASPEILTQKYLSKVKVISEILRPYGIKVYLSINFSSPSQIGGLNTSDPLNEDVIKWWQEKVSEIYSYMPEFGGFLVKANSEGLPGPHDYGRTHAQGANMLADILLPYRGIVMWRAFVYSPDDDDRAKQAYKEFVPLDGEFSENVIVQIKNGPIDFQPCEPFSPLFGALKKSAEMVELQITQEYLGHSNHLAYLAPMWKECLDSDTYQYGVGSTVKNITQGKYLSTQKVTAIAGVANIGDDKNWCGSIWAQANWYAFGRLAWNTDISSEDIAEEWIKQTFTDKDKFVCSVKDMMMTSRETVVKYMMPLGLHHIFAEGHHYGPEPWYFKKGMREDWLPGYYHNANITGIGFNRTEHGSNAVSQYQEPLRSKYNDVNNCPQEYLLWFHHVDWDHKLKNGESLWNSLCLEYEDGVRRTQSYINTWNKLSKYIDNQRFNDCSLRLERQHKDAIWWKDACLQYFQIYSGRDFPENISKAVYPLDELKKIKLPISIYEKASFEMLPQ